MTGSFPATGRLAGVDYGTVRIGIAISDPSRTLASPLENYTRRGLEGDACYFRQLVAEETIAAFVVGLPVHTSGFESQKSLESRRFGQWLAEVTGCPVTYHDERYTTAAAEQLLGMAQLTSKQRKKRRDMLAAQIILMSYLESTSPEPGEQAPLEDDEAGT